MVVYTPLSTLAPVVDFGCRVFFLVLIYPCYHDFSRATRKFRAHVVFGQLFCSLGSCYALSPNKLGPGTMLRTIFLVGRELRGLSCFSGRYSPPRILAEKRHAKRALLSCGRLADSLTISASTTESTLTSITSPSCSS